MTISSMSNNCSSSASAVFISCDSTLPLAVGSGYGVPSLETLKSSESIRLISGGSIAGADEHAVKNRVIDKQNIRKGRFLTGDFKVVLYFDMVNLSS